MLTRKDFSLPMTETKTTSVALVTLIFFSVIFFLVDGKLDCGAMGGVSGRENRSKVSSLRYIFSSDRFSV
jgi:hypothetical protein